MIKKFNLCFALMLPIFCSAQIYLLTYPRSGNHLFYFSLSHILNMPAVVLDTNNVAFLMVKPYQTTQNWYLTPISEIPKNVLLMCHYPKPMGLSLADQSKDYLIVIVRDYHECLPRQAFQVTRNYDKIDLEGVLKQQSKLYAFPQQNCLDYSDTIFTNFNYIIPLQCYEQWNENTRHLIYYEDLVTNFEETMQTCLDQLHITEHRFREFMDHYDEMMLICKNLYREKQAGTLSQNDIHYHQKKLMSTNMAKKFDALFRDRFPDLWEKYLKRYETIE